MGGRGKLPEQIAYTPPPPPNACLGSGAQALPEPSGLFDVSALCLDHSGASFYLVVCMSQMHVVALAAMER